MNEIDYIYPQECADQLKVSRRTFLSRHATKASFQETVTRYQTNKNDIRFNRAEFNLYMAKATGNKKIMSQSFKETRQLLLNQSVVK